MIVARLSPTCIGSVLAFHPQIWAPTEVIITGGRLPEIRKLCYFCSCHCCTKYYLTIDTSLKNVSTLSLVLRGGRIFGACDLPDKLSGVARVPVFLLLHAIGNPGRIFVILSGFLYCSVSLKLHVVYHEHKCVSQHKDLRLQSVIGVHIKISMNVTLRHLRIVNIFITYIA